MTLAEETPRRVFSSATSRSSIGGERLSVTLVSTELPPIVFFRDTERAPRVVVDIECSPNAPCPNMVFEDFNVLPPVGTSTAVKCLNVVSEVGLPGASLLFSILQGQLED